MNKSYRIRTEVGNDANKHIKVKLDQDISQFEILSLNVNQEEFYPFFNCEHGVLIGRVIGNKSIGVPNARVSLFIPIEESDISNSKIFGMYPFTNPRVRDLDGKRYNLLPRLSKERIDGTIRPKQPFGTFPSKEEIVTNDTFLEVYKKYYKYSTVTNDSGDYMLFGIPTGDQTIHMSVDITDIGEFSMKPSTMVKNLGYSENLFTDNVSKIKSSNNLDDLPQIETQDISVNVIPFCGDAENYDIGITRLDFKLRAELVSTFTVFGNAFTDGENHMWGTSHDGGVRTYEFYRSRDDGENGNTYNMNTKRNGIITEQIFELSNTVSDTNADSGTFNTTKHYTRLSDSQYVKYARDGDFVYIVPCNRKKIITNEFGKKIEVPYDSDVGIFTEFKGFFTFEYTLDDLPLDLTNDLWEGSDTFKISSLRSRFKFPQRGLLHRNANNKLRGRSFTDDDNNDTKNWRKQFYTFSGGSFYSIAKFNATMYNNTTGVHKGSQAWLDYQNNDFIGGDTLNNAGGSSRNNAGMIVTDDDANSVDDVDTLNTEHGYPSNATDQNGYDVFGGNWMNFSLYFPQFGGKRGNVNQSIAMQRQLISTLFSKNWSKGDNGKFYQKDNTQEIAGGIVNTAYYGRSDLHHTDFIEVPILDIRSFRTEPKGFFKTTGLSGTDYKRGEDYTNYITQNVNDDINDGGGRVDLNPSGTVDTKYYFYKGLGLSDCIEYLFELNII
jgi:hypothetical protein